ncbi:MAG TPA: maltose alpha-D-glucosyltransferase, partial [Acidimicrobiales bacterium]|nr:maltose alpha-D-glucosyltransferase [Acidimicrobiales bacterium]
NISDLVGFLEDAHRRGIRVIADLVMNHTSDEHPWFKESRSSRDNAKADWYVWNDDDQKWPDARVVFTDVERSNWTWDDNRQQYYWHRFYHHQPDLNYDNPEVADTMIDLVRFWLDLGFDGFRLDAVPYLYQRDGTSGEHLPETHAFIKRIRKQFDADYPGRILLAEANGWPSDVADYFGDGDECHLCFHFPLMPRLFMAVRREQRYPITEILAQTPVIDDGSQWAIFLRNHDELTLEQVSEEERDYLIAEYAKDPRMKRHMGIGRRLAPLLDNDRRTAELLYALILSLPGSPVIYYGDELLLGDNIYLGDRDSVRTPMQWSPDRNGGFSQADFAQLYLPPLMDPVYGFTALNVEAQLRNQGSFLHWLRRLLTERRALPVMGVGEMEVLPCANPSVLAYVRSGEVADILTTPPAKGPAVSVDQSIDELDWGRSAVLARTVPAGNESEADEVVRRHQAVLCVHNLSRFAQPAELALAKWAGSTPFEVLGRVPFPIISEEPYTITLPPYGFLWFDLVPEERPVQE